MEKKISDYLYLYLGCECIVDGTKTNLTAYHIEFQDDDTIKPILRPLSDMTEEEKKELRYVEQDVSSENILPQIKVSKILQLHLSAKSIAMTNKLRAMGFDCDGLIESGLALSSTSLTDKKE